MKRVFVAFVLCIMLSACSQTTASVSGETVVQGTANSDNNAGESAVPTETIEEDGADTEETTVEELEESADALLEEEPTEESAEEFEESDTTPENASPYIDALQPLAEQIAGLVAEDDIDGANRLDLYTSVPELTRDIMKEISPIFVDTSYGKVGFYRNGIYVGDFDKDVRSGHGVFLYCLDVTLGSDTLEYDQYYIGDWANDSPNGQGSFCKMQISKTYGSSHDFRTGGFIDGYFDGTIHCHSYWNDSIGINYDVVYHKGNAEYLYESPDNEGFYVMAEDVVSYDADGNRTEMQKYVEYQKREVENDHLESWN